MFDRRLASAHPLFDSEITCSYNSQDKSVTAYTVFCAEQAPSCQIAADIPFIFTEGAHTLVYRGTDPGVLFVLPGPREHGKAKVERKSLLTVSTELRTLNAN